MLVNASQPGARDYYLTAYLRYSLCHFLVHFLPISDIYTLRLKWAK